MSGSNRWLAGISAALAVLVAVSLIAALVTRNQPTREYPANTPEGVVQRYLKALADSDAPTAYTYLAANVQTTCSRDEWVQQASFSKDQLKDAQVLLQEVGTLPSGETSVTVQVTSVQFNRPFPVTPEEYSFTQQFLLKQDGSGTWKLSQTSWPIYGCPDLRKPLPVPATA